MAGTIMAALLMGYSGTAMAQVPGVGAPPVVMPSRGAMVTRAVQAIAPRDTMAYPQTDRVDVPTVPGAPFDATGNTGSPSYGDQIAETWRTPEFHIGDPRYYGLRDPAPGFGWSRVYADAVLTDQWGRVYDVRHGIDWDHGTREGRRFRQHMYGRHGDRGWAMHGEGPFTPHWGNSEWGYGVAQDETTTVETTTTPGKCTPVRVYPRARRARARRS